MLVFCTQKVFSSLDKVEIEPLKSLELLFNNVFNNFSRPASFNPSRSLWTSMQEWSSSQI